MNRTLLQVHASCHVCQGAGVQHRHFRDTAAVWKHMCEEHHACHDPECEGALTAFQTELELRCEVLVFVNVEEQVLEPVRNLRCLQVLLGEHKHNCAMRYR